MSLYWSRAVLCCGLMVASLSFSSNSFGLDLIFSEFDIHGDGTGVSGDELGTWFNPNVSQSSTGILYNIPAFDDKYRFIGFNTGPGNGNHGEGFDISLPAGAQFELTVTDAAANVAVPTEDATASGFSTNVFKWLYGGPDKTNQLLLDTGHATFLTTGVLNTNDHPVVGFGAFADGGRFGTYWVEVEITGIGVPNPNSDGGFTNFGPPPPPPPPAWYDELVDGDVNPDNTVGSAITLVIPSAPGVYDIVGTMQEAVDEPDAFSFTVNSPFDFEMAAGGYAFAWLNNGLGDFSTAGDVWSDTTGGQGVFLQGLPAGDYSVWFNTSGPTNWAINITVAVPEPQTYSLGLFALAAVGFVAWRRRS